MDVAFELRQDDEWLAKVWERFEREWTGDAEIALRGLCPRCDHPTAAALPAAGEAVRSGVVQCACTAHHPGQDGRTGCGAFGLLQADEDGRVRHLPYAIAGRPALRVELAGEDSFQAESYDGYCSIVWTAGLDAAGVIERLRPTLPAPVGDAVFYDRRAHRHRVLEVEDAVERVLRPPPRWDRRETLRAARLALRRARDVVSPLRAPAGLTLRGTPRAAQTLARLVLQLPGRFPRSLCGTPLLRLELEHLTVVWEESPVEPASVGLITDVVDEAYLLAAIRATGSPFVADRAESLMRQARFLAAVVPSGVIATREELHAAEMAS